MLFVPLETLALASQNLKVLVSNGISYVKDSHVPLKRKPPGGGGGFVRFKRARPYGLSAPLVKDFRFVDT